MPPQRKRTISAEDLYRLRTFSGLRLAPDGKHVIYSLQRINRKTQEKFSNLWVLPTETGRPRQFTFGDQNDTSPRWSPDGSRIAFLSDRAGKEKPAQIYLMPFLGGEALPLCDIPGEINSLSWSPNGKKLLCAVRKRDPEALEREKDAQKKKLGVTFRRCDRLFYKLDGFGYLPHGRWHLWLVDARSGKARQLTDHPIFDELDPAWSPDGKWIVFTSNRSPDPDQRPDAIDLFVTPVSSASAEHFRKIEAPVGEKRLPSVSPDGRWIAYLGVEGENLGYKNQSLWIVPFDGSAPPRNLTETCDLHASSWTINDICQAEQMPPTWSADGRKIYFTAVLHGSTHLYGISLDGRDLQPVIAPDGVVGSFSFDCNQSRLAFSFATLCDPTQVRLLDFAASEERLLLLANRALLDDIDLGQFEEAWIKGKDGNDLQGWILKPPGFDPSRKYPSILEIHGGPLTQYGHHFMHEFYFLAAHGYIVHFCNPRGGRGYGEEHARAIWGGWGGADYDDLMSWTDYISSLPYVDPGRMGVTGGSYGGYMTLWIVGHTRRFKAAVASRCVSNLISLWGSSDMNWIFQQHLADKPPFEDLQTFWDHSPMKYIGNVRTPTLIIHNEMDLRCPIEQGEQVFVALKRLGIETEMVRFPDEFHGLSRNGRTDRRIARLEHILRWFKKYLKN